MNVMKKKWMLCFVVCCTALLIRAQQLSPTYSNYDNNHGTTFESVETLLPTPNTYRSASGAPGYAYWQQKVDYEIDCRLHEKDKILEGSEWITYHNNSPDVLDYLWLELAENQHHPEQNAGVLDPNKMPYRLNKLKELEDLQSRQVRFKNLGVIIHAVEDEAGHPLPYTINKTLMRVDLTTPLSPKMQVRFRVKWQYGIPERKKIKSHARGGYELLEDGNALFTIVQWYPRLCNYNDYQGWDLRQFTAISEFNLCFGDFKVRMTVPEDFVVAATGQCQNYNEVLRTEQFKRWELAQSAREPVEIITLKEAEINTQGKTSAKSVAQTKVWVYEAQNVRDFAWTGSRRFIWDAMPTEIAGKKIMCMSLYPKESYNLYRKYSTKVVAHTLHSYSHYTVPYPYPVAISVEADNGMEYPMICFNHGRCEKDGSYTEQTKNRMIQVVIHEIGHNFFPMIINSNERRWSWMDEGFNTFFEYLTEQSFDPYFISRRGPIHSIVPYMRSDKELLEPIMTMQDNIVNVARNVYHKTATGLNILRETIMGRALFDKAFKTYATRWAFKQPTPADFFRTMEDASGMDLGWFFREWFFGILPVDIALNRVKVFMPSSREQDSIRAREMAMQRQLKDISHIRDRAEHKEYLTGKDTALLDKYSKMEKEDGVKKYYIEQDLRDPFFSKQVKPFDSLRKYIYELHFTNKGGSVMPLILEWTYADGTKEVESIAAEIWRYNEKEVQRVFVKDKAVAFVALDPYEQTADIRTANNICPLRNITLHYVWQPLKDTDKEQAHGVQVVREKKKKK